MRGWFWNTSIVYTKIGLPETSKNCFGISPEFIRLPTPPANKTATLFIIITLLFLCNRNIYIMCNPVLFPRQCHVIAITLLKEILIMNRAIERIITKLQFN